MHEYSHGSTEPTGCSITGGTYYNPATSKFPEEYKGDYFFTDFCSGWIRVLYSPTRQASEFATDGAAWRPALPAF